jgi:hypothetical protein
LTIGVADGNKNEIARLLIVESLQGLWALVRVG